MAKPLLNSCCRCLPLRTGSIITGIASILMSIVTIIIVLMVRAHFKTILFDFLPPSVVRIVIVFNLCMTILISAIMVVGAVKVKTHFIFRFFRISSSIIDREPNRFQSILCFSFFAAKPLFDATVGCSRIHVDHFIVVDCHLHGRHIHHRRTLYRRTYMVYRRFNHHW